MPLCKGPTRRDFFRAGGASLFGMSMVDFFRARAAAPGKPPAKAKHMILIWMAGGPPHQDMFDMKPDTPPPFGSELKQGKSNVPGMEFCDLMPRLARCADRLAARASRASSSRADRRAARCAYRTTRARRPRRSSQE